MGIALIVVGILVLLFTSTSTRRAVKRDFGEVNHQTMEHALLWKSVPKWVSLVGLVGYALIAIGVIALFVL